MTQTTIIRPSKEVLFEFWVRGILTWDEYIFALHSAYPMTPEEYERRLALQWTPSVPCGMCAVRILAACEMSGVVRDAFAALGHDVMSCDLLPSERPGAHYQGDVRDVLNDGWDMMIAFPPCTHLAVSGARWFPLKRVEQREAVEFVRLLWNAPIARIAIENPIGVLSSLWREPTQIIQPWQYGHGETKATCLWLKNLPKLTPTNIVDGREQRIWKMPPSPTRAQERSRTYEGIAQAMAQQWGTPEALMSDMPLFRQEAYHEPA